MSMNITIIGAGNTGLAMAAHSAEQGHRVTLWNRSEETISQLIDTHTIYSNGKVNGEFELHLVTTDMKEALIDPDVVLIATPSFAHKDLAEKIGKNISKETLILLCPGRTFGALEFKVVYDDFNQQFNQTIAETQTSIYTCRKTGADSVEIISIKYNVLFSAADSQENDTIFERLPAHLQRQLEPAESIIETSIGSVGMILHCAPSLLNIGWTEHEKYEFKHYTEGITLSIAKLLERIDEERIQVSKKLGTEVESVKEWLKRVYKVEGETLYESIQNTEAYETIDAPNILDNRYITEDVPNGLVPLESAGLYLGLEMKHTSMIIDLASSLLDKDFRESGRDLNKVFQGDTKEIDAFINRSEVT